MNETFFREKLVALQTSPIFDPMHIVNVLCQNFFVTKHLITLITFQSLGTMNCRFVQFQFHYCQKTFSTVIAMVIWVVELQREGYKITVVLILVGMSYFYLIF